MSTVYRLYRKFAYRIFIPYMAFFLIYIGCGYYFNLTTAFSFLPKAQIFILCVAIVAIIYVFVRHAGYVISQARQIKGFAGLVWILSFLILFAISGYGFVTSSMLLFEGPVVAREDVAEAITTISKLLNVVKSAPHPEEYEDLRGKVEQLQTQLDTEIMNISQGYCGIGPVAKTYLNQLAQLLPNIRLITGTDRDHSCDNRSRLTGIQNLYDKQIAEGLQNSAVTTRLRLPERRALADTVAPVLESDLEGLNKLQQSLSGIPSFIGNLELYHEAVRVLEAANADYARAYTQTETFFDLSNAGYPARLKTADLEQIGSGVQVLNTLLSRLDRLTTYLYFAIAFACDLFAAFAVSTVFREYEAAGGYGQPSLVGRTDVQFLWRPEPHPIPARSFAHGS